MTSRGREYRMYPTKEQEKLLVQFLGASRFAWNWCLSQYNTAHEAGIFLSGIELQKQFNALKKTDEFAWLKQMPCNLQDNAHNVYNAWQRVYKKVKDTKKPVFKRRKEAGSCPVNAKVLREEKNGLVFLGGSKMKIKTIVHRPLNGAIKAATVKRNSAGQWFIVFRVDTETTVSTTDRSQLPSVGIDLGLKNLAVLSTEKTFSAPKKYRTAEKKLQRLQRRLSKKQRGSSNRNKARQKLASLHVHVSNQRKDYAHKVSSTVVSESQAIAVENLNVKGMQKGWRSLRKATVDAAYGQLRSFLKYKSLSAGVRFVEVKRYERSTGVCLNTLQHMTPKLTLADRTWTCDCCGQLWDRDIAAAMVIELLGRDTAKVKLVETRVSTYSMKSCMQARLKKQETLRAASDRSIHALAG